MEMAFSSTNSYPDEEWRTGIIDPGTESTRMASVRKSVDSGLKFFAEREQVKDDETGEIKDIFVERIRLQG